MYNYFVFVISSTATEKSHLQLYFNLHVSAKLGIFQLNQRTIYSETKWAICKRISRSESGF